MFILNNVNDKVMTPDFIVDEVLEEFGYLIEQREGVLEPFLGEGAFYNKLLNYSEDVSWCEIEKGVDFLDYKDSVDWIITNPPYSVFKQMLPKMLEVADNVVMVIPSNKLVSSMPRLMDIERAGCGIKRIHYLGSGRQLKFPFGFPVAAIYVKKGYKGDTKITYAKRCLEAKSKGG